MPAPLKDYLEDAGCLKVGLSTHDDFKVLHRVYAFEPAGFVELQELVKRYEIGDLGLQKVFAILFQQKISKSQRLTNWDAARLTEAQQHYAALDAWACIRIYERLTSGQFDPLASPYRHVVEPPTTSD
jgi:ribonuclease D